MFKKQTVILRVFVFCLSNLTKEDIRSVIEIIKELYLEDMIPWICGYSGGKDSTAVVQLVWYALQELPKEKLKKIVHVISTDTLVESPVVAIWATESLKKMKQGAKEQGLPIVPHRLTPTTTNTFWVNLIGRGYPYPRRDFRWCTDRMKIDASNRFIKSILDAESEAIMVLGSRKAESAVRKAVLESISSYHNPKRTGLSASRPEPAFRIGMFCAGGHFVGHCLSCLCPVASTPYLIAMLKWIGLPLPANTPKYTRLLSGSVASMMALVMMKRHWQNISDSI